MEEPVPSAFLYEGVMEEIAKIQGDRAAIIILENPNGTTTYLRHNISQDDAAAILKSAYPSKEIEQ